MKRYANALICVAGALIFMLMAFYNGYPLLNSDTGTYIYSGFEHFVPMDRPVTYGTFLFVFSLKHSLWLAAFAQCLLLAFLIIRLLRWLFPGITGAATLGMLLLTSVGTIASWYAGQLMADIFAPILCIAILLFLFDDAASSRWLRPAYAFTIFCSVLMHNSYVVIFTLITGFLYLWYFAGRRPAFIKRTLLVFPVIAVMSWVGLCSMNYKAGNGFIPSKGAPIFMVAKLCESGLLKPYLEETCPQHNYKICSYKEQLPNNTSQFLWDPKSILYQSGGWDSCLPEYKAVTHGFFSQPKYILRYASYSIEATLRELTMLHIDESYEGTGNSYLADSQPYGAIKKHVQHELNEVETCKLNSHTIDVIFLDHLYDIVFLISTLLVLFFWRQGRMQVFGKLYVVVIVFLLFNAFTGAAIATVNTRLNSRDVWLLPMLNFAFIYDVIQLRVLPWLRTGRPSQGSIH